MSPMESELEWVLSAKVSSISILFPTSDLYSLVRDFSLDTDLSDNLLNQMPPSSPSILPEFYLAAAVLHNIFVF